MKHDYNVRHLNVDAFARAAGQLEGEVPLAHLIRLQEEASDPADQPAVHYTAEGLVRADSAGVPQVWLKLAAQVDLSLVCQRCLGPATLSVQFEREFRFVASEEVAALEDEESEEDLLVLSRDFNVLELVEDELIMALPVVPKHPVCPDPVSLQVADRDFAEAAVEKPNPFAVLQQLKKKT